jgi:hypothetical protein
MSKATVSAVDIATPLDTKKSLLQKAGRKVQAAPIRVAFVQQGKGKTTEPGPLATLVTNHDELGLDLFLFAHAMASSSPYAIHRSAPVLARALAQMGKQPVGAATISRAWARLQDLQLIERSRFSKLAKITLLREDGTGAPYTPPGASDPPERYFKLPFAYWYDDWNAKLSLPAKAVLLIALTMKDGFRLPVERGPEWYGLSPDTINRGLDDLRRHRLLHYTDTPKKAPLSSLGYTLERRYSLRPPFSKPRPVDP